ncbi:DNA polymerase alpha catalytic subunit, partial [Nowakowskiella sp. JEL0078]
MIPLEKFFILKVLTKKPEAYADAKSQPHVQVALKMRAANLNVRTGETIPYVVCVDKNPTVSMESSLALKAQPPFELQKKDTPFRIDFDWYLENQVHPCVNRLFAPIEGSDSVQIAEMLGIDTAKFRRKETEMGLSSEESIQTSQAGLTFEEKFASVNKWKPTCSICGESHDFQPVVRINENGKIMSAFDCPNCKKRLSPASLVSSLRKEIEKHFYEWDTSPYVCDDYGHRRHDISASGVYCVNKDAATVKREVSLK